ncbi:sulfurtransferase-like selenium metabolism protein YedF [Desulfogranum marinum]|jgi:selenium metabolism protein YedF|uniref:sulfurtransferase-like selenium metabolism protein YedF n=1 Tax=Desulfogranum marinum TaxID=453220 RepID=UPI0019630427|nr:sulfurtransferase-like selenium metabolism protein YedF [Desulfogranum marinum]MBM9511987.1 sulfurtransferase-like selenium metabolism protein YedF [Desulfogranum marinum]
MEPISLDCIGLPCPKPVLKTKEALEQGHTLISVTVDNEASKNNVTRFGRNQGCDVSETVMADGNYQVLIQSDGSIQESITVDNDAYQCDLPHQGKDSLIYVIAADTMGRGSDELGWALLQTFIQTIKEVTPPPSKILFYNSGVKLVVEESGAIEALKELQNNGVEILVCGTCLDFYELKSAIKIGQISNMYDIMDTMVGASKVVSPL